MQEALCSFTELKPRETLVSPVGKVGLRREMSGWRRRHGPEFTRNIRRTRDISFEARKIKQHPVVLQRRILGKKLLWRTHERLCAPIRPPPAHRRLHKQTATHRSPQRSFVSALSPKNPLAYDGPKMWLTMRVWERRARKSAAYTISRMSLATATQTAVVRTIVIVSQT